MDEKSSVCGFEGTKREEAVIVHRIVNDGSFFYLQCSKEWECIVINSFNGHVIKYVAWNSAVANYVKKV